MPNSIAVWGKTLAATGGTLGFLLSTLFWFGISGQLSLVEIAYGASLTIGCCLGIAATLLPSAGNKVRAGIILGASLLTLSFQIHWLDLVGPVPLAYALLGSWWIALMVWGGFLVLVSPGGRGKSGVSDVEGG